MVANHECVCKPCQSRRVSGHSPASVYANSRRVQTKLIRRPKLTLAGEAGSAPGAPKAASSPATASVTIASRHLTRARISRTTVISCLCRLVQLDPNPRESTASVVRAAISLGWSGRS
jgi:hypothetical protein